MINYKNLVAFVTVVRKKSFTVAAKELFLTQPAISWQIKNLEDEIELVLIERKERGTKLTEAGKQFFFYAEKVIKAQEQLVEEMKQFKCMEKGRLLAGASTVPGEYIIPQYISLFKETYPASDIGVVIGSSESIVEKLLNDEIHVGVVGIAAEDSRIESKLLLRDQIVLACRKGHPLTKKSGVKLKDLIEYPLILREQGSGSRKALEDTLEEKEIRNKDFTYYTELSGSYSGIVAIKNSDAITFISSIVAKEHLKSKEIEIIPIEDLQMDRNFYVIYQKSKTLSPLSETFLKFMLKRGLE